MWRALTVASLAAALAFTPALALAQDGGTTDGGAVEAVDVTAEELDVREPVLDAASPLRGLVRAWQNLRLGLTRDPEARADLELRYANQDLLGIRRAVEAGRLDSGDLARATERYEYRLDAARDRIAELRESDPERFERLTERFTDGELSRQRLLAKLEELHESGKIAEVRDRALDRLRDVVQGIDPDQLRERIESLRADEDGEVPQLQRIEVLKHLSERLPERAAAAVNDAWRTKLERFQSAGEGLTPEELERRARSIIQHVRDGEISNPAVDRLIERADLGEAGSSLRQRVEGFRDDLRERRAERQAQREGPQNDGTCLCTLEFAPVCGVNGETYSNGCRAACNGVEIDHRGRCGEAGASDRADPERPVSSPGHPAPLERLKRRQGRQR